MLLFCLVCELEAICEQHEAAHRMTDSQFATYSLVELSKLLDSQLTIRKIFGSQLADSQLADLQLAGLHFRITRFFNEQYFRTSQQKHFNASKIAL